MSSNYKVSLGVSTVVIAALSLSAVAGFAMKRAPQTGETAVQTAAPDASKQAVQDLLAKMTAKYKGLTSYSADGSFAVKSGDKNVDFPSKLAFKAGKALVTVTTPEGASTRIFDGKTLFVTSAKEPKSYRKQAFNSPTQGLQAALSQVDIGLIPLLFTDPAVTEKILPSNATAAMIDPKGDTIDGVAVDVITASMGVGQGTISFAIGKDDSLLRRITIAEQKDGVPTTTITTTYTNVKINPALDDSQFVFTPAAGQVAQAAPAEPEYFDPRLKKGASPLPFSGTDTLGKPVTLAQYKGKVTLVDFWATWCGPCREELPNVVSVYGKYKPKGFDVVGVSLDDKADKPKLMKFTVDNKMPWRQVFDGSGWDSKIAKSYGVKAIPFTLLIGKDGKIAAVNPRGPELEPAVKAALAAN